MLTRLIIKEEDSSKSVIWRADITAVTQKSGLEGTIMNIIWKQTGYPRRKGSVPRNIKPPKLNEEKMENLKWPISE